MQHELIPIGTTVRVTTDLTENLSCQVIDLDINKHTGEVFYKLGHITPRTGFLRRFPKKQNLQHWVKRDALEILANPSPNRF